MLLPWRSGLRRGLLWLLLWQVTIRVWRKLRPGQRPIWLEAEPVRRLRWLVWPAEQLVERLDVQPGMRVVEVGAGTGCLTIALAQAVGPTGQVVATEHRNPVAHDLRIATLEQGLIQVTVHAALPTALPATATGSDLIVFTSTFGGLPDKQAVAQEVYQHLRPGGTLAVTELVVDPDYSLASTVVTNLVLAGFAIEDEIGHLGAYTVIARKPA